MQTYRELFRTPEFGPFFITCSLQIAGSTVSGLALATLVYGATGSPLLSALSMFGPSFAQLLGAMFLLSAADRLPPRAAMAGLALISTVATATLAIPGLPLGAIYTILFGLGLCASVGGGVRFGLLTDILTSKGYLLGRSVLNMAVGVMQICGYALGGLLVAALSPRGALLISVVLSLCAATVARFGLRYRRARSGGRPSPAESWRMNVLLWSSPARRYVLLALWVPNGLVVGCESLFVPYAPEHAGLLFASAAAGMLIGDITAGRFLPQHLRSKLGAPLRLLLAAPFLLFAMRPGLIAAAVIVLVAAIGFSASLLLQEKLISLTPVEIQGQALGLQGSGTLAGQGISAALAGGLAQLTGPATAMTVVAAVSVAVTLCLAPGLRPGARTEQLTGVTQ
jgi:predicted MFS family arabinose efflux permease